MSVGEREREQKLCFYLDGKQLLLTTFLFSFSPSLNTSKTKKKVLVLLVVALGMVGQINSPWQVSKDGREERREDKSSPSFSSGFFSKRVRFPEKDSPFPFLSCSFLPQKKTELPLGLPRLRARPDAHGPGPRAGPLLRVPLRRREGPR